MTETTATKQRIFQIAKELNISHTEIIEFLDGEGIKVASHMSPVNSEVYERILGEFAKEKVIVDRQRKEVARRDVEEARRKAVGRGRFENVLTIGEQRQIEIEEAERAKKAAKEEAERKKKEEAERKKEEELKKLAHEELKRREAESKADREKTEKEAARKEKKIIPADKSPKPTKEEPKTTPSAKPKLKRIDIREIEGKIEEGRKKPLTRREKRDLEPEKAKSVEQTLRQTLASMATKDRKRKPVKRDKVVDEDILSTDEQRPEIKIHEFMSVADLANAMNVVPMDVIGKCMELGIMVTINQRLDLETLSLLAEDLGFDIHEEDVLNDDAILESLDEKIDQTKSETRPPVVTVMGHVDHGKTSLLDHIRSANVAVKESGGITQHIGAYEVTVRGGQRITFLDTPGHAAFTAMRARGAQVTDIVVLVVAADDAVMPQTLEAINHANAAEVNIVVAINKIDKPEADTERVRRELSEKGVLVEEWGGKIQSAEVSAKKGIGIDDLLDKILVEAEVMDLKAVKKSTAVGTIIESKLDKGLGPVATVLVQKGTLKTGETFLCGSQIGRVRAMLDQNARRVESALPADPVQIQGFEDVPQAGDRFIVFEDEREAKRISAERTRIRREMEYRQKSVRTLDEISRQIREGEVRQLPILLKADVDGSLEALTDSLQNLATSEVSVDVIHRGVGNVSENDVLLALASNAVIIAFGVNTSSGAKLLAKKDDVEIRNYDVIYNAVNEVKLALEGLLEPEKVETPLGIAEVRATFSIPKAGLIAGCYMKEGKAIRNARLRVTRNDEFLHEGQVTSLKRFKDDVKEVQEGFECGIGVEGFSDFEEGDLIEIYEIKEVKRTLA
jgi:translation initiation factor IF-2